MVAAVQTLANGTGRRKNAVARVRLVPESGKIIVNERPAEQYFPRQTLQAALREPLRVANVEGRYDVVVAVTGGGVAGQAGAVRHGIARALARVDEMFRPVLHKAGFLTRDPRMKGNKVLDVVSHDHPPLLCCLVEKRVIRKIS